MAFPWVVTSTGLGGFMFVCVFYDGNSRRLNRNGFMDKLRIEPVIPGFIPYTTAASLKEDSRFMACQALQYCIWLYICSISKYLWFENIFMD